MMQTLKNSIADFPHKAGCYLFKDHRGDVLYVGKAKDLKKRVSQYFGHDKRPQLPFLMEEARTIDFIVASSELEALFLENTLIKQYLPPYNIKLRDDKNYAFIRINYATEIPQIQYARKIEDEKTSKYFGPYSSALKIKRVLDTVRKIFPYCSNSEIGKRPCFYYYLHRCPGICIGAITPDEYTSRLKNIEQFLRGDTSAIKKELRQYMKQASRRRQFERAAKLRDQLQSLELLDEHQVMMFPKHVDWDFISVFEAYGDACINVFKVREGRLMDKENFIYQSRTEKGREQGIANASVIETFLENYYSETSDIPREIYIQTAVGNIELIRTLLATRVKHVVPVTVPTRGQKLKLIQLGITNAEEYLKKWQASSAANLDQVHETLEQLQQLLLLPTFPRRIEGYDISNIQGTNPVGSMVVTKDGLPAKSEYRKFKINVKQTPDDFAMMREMLSRRLRRLENKEYGIENNQSAWPTPDLIVIDGGKGQLRVAHEEIKRLRLKIPVIGLAKRIEEIFLPENPEPIVLDHTNPVLQLLQRLRDEAHRFAITFHRSLRSKAATKSALDSIPGIGPKTKKLLKQKFGTVAKIKATSIEDLADVIGRQKAEQIRKYL